MAEAPFLPPVPKVRRRLLEPHFPFSGLLWSAGAEHQRVLGPSPGEPHGHWAVHAVL